MEKDKKFMPERSPAGTLLRTAQEGIVTDPLGSYTGLPEDVYEQPVQDADDL